MYYVSYYNLPTTIYHVTVINKLTVRRTPNLIIHFLIQFQFLLSWIVELTLN